MALAEDLSAFFATDDFAIAATAGWGATVNVIFDAEHVEALEMLSTTSPVCLARGSEVSASRVGQTLTISGVSYTIRDVRPRDDGALVTLRLEKQ